MRIHVDRSDQQLERIFGTSGTAAHKISQLKLLKQTELFVSVPHKSQSNLKPRGANRTCSLNGEQ